MPHVDEGTLHALLDGELAPAEVREVRTHFATCPACAARLDEAKQLLAETERLVSALEAPKAPPAPAVRPVSSPPLFAHQPVSPDPVVLIPHNPSPNEVRRHRLRLMAVAAGLLMALGAGLFGLQMRGTFFNQTKGQRLRIRPEDFQQTQAAIGAAESTIVAPATPTTLRPPPTQPPPKVASTPTPTPAPTPSSADAVRKTGAPPPAAVSRETGPSSQAGRLPPAREAAKSEAKDEDSTPNDRATIEERARKATEELDRQKIRDRAAQATSALDAEKRAAAAQRRADSARAAAAAAASQERAANTPAPAQTWDQQAQIITRIGLDDATRQLGGPLHAIDGMARVLVGLVSPRAVPGADTSRLAVRAVYIDRAGHTVFLDQQRLRPGQDAPVTPQAGQHGELRWASGGTLLVLQGEGGPDSLRILWRRVR